MPRPGFPRSELDGRLRELLLDALRGAAWLPGAAGAELVPGPGRVARPARRRTRELPALLAAAGFDRLLAPLPGGPAPGPALAELGVHRLSPAELVERLLGVERPAGWWRALYAALEPAADTVPGLLAELRALPVPLADGRLVAGPPTVLLPPPAGDANPDDPVAQLAALGLPGLHIADPDAVHPLLARLGAGAADPAALLEHPALAAAVDRSLDDAEAGLDPAPLAAAVLALVGEHPARRGGRLRRARPARRRRATRPAPTS